MPNITNMDKRDMQMGGPVENAYGFELMTTADLLTAKAGGGQSAVPTITTQMARFTTVASANDSATLPFTSQLAGVQLTISNAAGVNSMNVFPAAGEAINALAANAAFAVAAGKTLTLSCFGVGVWHTILSA